MDDMNIGELLVKETEARVKLEGKFDRVVEILDTTEDATEAVDKIKILLIKEPK